MSDEKRVRCYMRAVDQFPLSRRIEAAIALADEEQAALRADRNVAYGMLTSAQHRAEAAEAELATVVRARNAAMRQVEEERRAKEGNIRALNAAIERAEAAEAELERLRAGIRGPA